MEDNNNIIIKGLAIILIAILGLNVYRTETTKKELATLSNTVSSIQAQLDSLEYPVGQPAAPIGTNNKQVTDLTKKVYSLESKITALQGTVDRLAKASSQTTTRPAATTGSQSQSGAAAVSTTGNVGRVSVSAKVKVEDRYVRGSVVLPKVSMGPVGVVVVNVIMDHSGDVTSAKINKDSTISDEDILDACKEAALKTRFSINWEVSDKHPATITYTFTAK